MTNKFDELAKGLAQSVTRRQALRRFGVGLAGTVLASLGLANKAQASNCLPQCVKACRESYGKGTLEYDYCVSRCYSYCFL